MKIYAQHEMGWRMRLVLTKEQSPLPCQPREKLLSTRMMQQEMGSAKRVEE